MPNLPIEGGKQKWTKSVAIWEGNIWGGDVAARKGGNPAEEKMRKLDASQPVVESRGRGVERRHGCATTKHQSATLEGGNKGGRIPLGGMHLLEGRVVRSVAKRRQES